MRDNKDKHGLWYSLCVALCALLLFGCGGKEKESLSMLVGVWDGYGVNGEIVRLSVDENNGVVVSIDQAEMAGVYTVDLSSRPFRMVYELGEGEMRLEALLDFLSTDALQIDVAEEGQSAPISFSDTCMILKRNV